MYKYELRRQNELETPAVYILGSAWAFIIWSGDFFILKISGITGNVPDTGHKL